MVLFTTSALHCIIAKLHETSTVQSNDQMLSVASTKMCTKLLFFTLRAHIIFGLVLSNFKPHCAMKWFSLTTKFKACQSKRLNGIIILVFLPSIRNLCLYSFFFFAGNSYYRLSQSSSLNPVYTAEQLGKDLVAEPIERF